MAIFTHQLRPTSREHHVWPRTSSMMGTTSTIKSAFDALICLQSTASHLFDILPVEICKPNVDSSTVCTQTQSPWPGAASAGSSRRRVRMTTDPGVKTPSTHPGRIRKHPALEVHDLDAAAHGLESRKNDRGRRRILLADVVKVSSQL